MLKKMSRSVETFFFKCMSIASYRRIATAIAGCKKIQFPSREISGNASPSPTISGKSKPVILLRLFPVHHFVMTKSLPPFIECSFWGRAEGEGVIKEKVFPGSRNIFPWKRYVPQANKQRRCSSSRSRTLLPCAFWRIIVIKGSHSSWKSAKMNTIVFRHELDSQITHLGLAMSRGEKDKHKKRVEITKGGRWTETSKRLFPPRLALFMPLCLPDWRT